MKNYLKIFLICCIVILALTVTASAADEHLYDYIIEDFGLVTITNCYASGHVVIPSELGGYPVTRIGEYAFAYNWDLTSVVIPDTVTHIEYGAFYCCKNLNYVTFGKNVAYIDDYAFDYCENLLIRYYPGGADAWNETIKQSGACNEELFAAQLYNAVSYIGWQDGYEYEVTHYGTATITKAYVSGDVVIPEYLGGYPVTEIGRYAFADNINITSVVIPDTVTKISKSAFAYCWGMKSVTFGSGLEYIGDYAFLCCTGLTLLDIAANVSIIGTSAFENCDGLKMLYLNGANMNIGYAAFQGCDSLTGAILEDKVAAIGDYAFVDCRNLRTIYIGLGIRTIGENAFCRCWSLQRRYYFGGAWSWEYGIDTIYPGNEYLYGAALIDDYVIKMYTADGRIGYNLNSQAEDYKTVGWYYTPPVLMYAMDGRTIYVEQYEVDDYQAVGWFVQ